MSAVTTEEKAKLATARRARDEGAERVLGRAGEEWRERAVRIIRKEFSGKTGTGEDFRRVCELAGMVVHHPNAWGALCLCMKRAGMLRETGEWRAPRERRSHARPTRVYEVL